MVTAIRDLFRAAMEIFLLYKLFHCFKTITPSKYFIFKRKSPILSDVLILYFLCFSFFVCLFVCFFLDAAFLVIMEKYFASVTVT